MCRTVANILSDFFASPLVSAAVFALGVGAIGLWLAAAWWTYTDAGRRTESSVLAALAAGWIVVSTPFLLPLSMAIYRAARPQVAAADARAERLAINLSEEAVAASCPQCASRIEPGWLRCPRCTAWLAAPCRACGQWTDPTFDICPLCGSEEHLEPRVLAPTMLESMASGQATTAGAEWPMAAVAASTEVDQRGVRIAASSSRPRSYAASRDSLSASS